MEVLLSKEYITGLIDKKGMSKAEFAKQMGVARQNLDALLESKKKDINTVIRMAEVLGMPLNEFLYGRTTDVRGFLKFNGKIKEIQKKEDILDVLKEIEELEKKEV